MNDKRDDKKRPLQALPTEEPVHDRGGRSSNTRGSTRDDPSPPRLAPSGRATWSSAPVPPGSALTPRRSPQTISLTDTAIQAMPSTSRDLFVLHEKDGAFASAIRILATRLETMRVQEHKRSFLITSVGDGEGKTVLATNLALAMSEDAERRVALVDANFRRPRTGELFNLDASRGLLAALAGERPLSQCIARVMGRNLIVLQAGGQHKNPAAVLGSAKFKSLLAELSEAVDFLIVDAPSALPFADVPLVAQHVDGVVMVIAENRTKRRPLDQALDTIGRHRIAGHVYFEHVPTKSPRKK